MAVFKVSFIITGPKQGFTESYYMEEASSVAAAAAMGQKAPQRQGLLGYPFLVEAVRATPVIPGTFPPALLPGKSAGSFGGVNPNNRQFRADQGKACIRAQAVTVTGQKRQIYLRACPDFWIDRDSTNPNQFDLSDPNFTAKWNAWLAALQAAPALGIRYRNQPGAAQRTVLAITEDPTTGMYLVETVVAHGLVVGDSVVVKGAKGVNLKGIRGVRRVVRVESLTKVVLNAYPESAPAIALTSPAVIYPLTYTTTAITEAHVLAVGTRKVGRPFGQQRGRR